MHAAATQEVLKNSPQPQLQQANCDQPAQLPHLCPAKGIVLN